MRVSQPPSINVHHFAITMGGPIRPPDVERHQLKTHFGGDDEYLKDTGVPFDPKTVQLVVRAKRTFVGSAGQGFVRLVLHDGESLIYGTSVMYSNCCACTDSLKVLQPVISPKRVNFWCPETSSESVASRERHIGIPPNDNHRRLNSTARRNPSRRRGIFGQMGENYLVESRAAEGRR